MATVSYESGSSENNVSQQGSMLLVNDNNTARKRNLAGELKNIFDEKFRDSLKTFNNDPNIEKKFKDLDAILDLMKMSEEFENREYSRQTSYIERTKNTLEQLYPRYSAKLKVLERLVAEWKPHRENLKKKLSFDIPQLDQNFKWSTIARVCASSVEISGTVGGLMFRSETGWANYAFNAASFCGLCGLLATVLEVKESNRILDEVSNAIENDNKLLLPIVNWFKETKELDPIVKELFPHGIDKDIVRQIQAASAEQAGYLKIFEAGLKSNAGKDEELLENVDFLCSLQYFAKSEVAAVWWNRIISRKHPINLEQHKMDLQIALGHSQYCQSVPGLPLEQQRLTSLPVAGRIVLNLLTLYDSVADLRRGGNSTHTHKLRKYLEKMQEQLEMIEATVQMMKQPRED